MPRTDEDVGIFLHSLGRSFERSHGATEGESTYLLRAADGTVVAIVVAAPIVEVNVNIGPAPADEKHQLKLYRRLLELNSTDLMHAAFGIEGGNVVLGAALQLENLDQNELDATLSDIDEVLVRHTKELAHFARD